MKSIIKRFIFNHKISKILIRPLCQIHTISYKLISALAIVAENVLHPKHRIMNYHRFFVDNVSENDVVLDIGFGNGALTFCAFAEKNNKSK